MGQMLTINTERGLGQTNTGKILPVYNDQHPALRQMSFTFNFETPQVNPHELAADLLTTMESHKGLGLAAPQCGISLRVFALASGTVCFNPQIINAEGEVRMKEGCLSFPGLLLPINRPEVVTLSWYDVNGEKKEETFSGITARCILHEFNHLNGILFTDLVGNLTLSMAKKKRAKLVKKIQRFQNSPQQKLQKTLSIKTGN
jgi:peptide deformylase